MRITHLKADADGCTTTWIQEYEMEVLLGQDW